MSSLHLATVPSKQDQPGPWWKGACSCGQVDSTHCQKLSVIKFHCWFAFGDKSNFLLVLPPPFECWQVDPLVNDQVLGFQVFNDMGGRLTRKQVWRSIPVIPVVTKAASLFLCWDTLRIHAMARLCRLALADALVRLIRSSDPSTTPWRHKVRWSFCLAGDTVNGYSGYSSSSILVNVFFTFHSLAVLYLETCFVSRVATCRNTSQHRHSCFTKIAWS